MGPQVAAAADELGAKLCCPTYHPNGDRRATRINHFLDNELRELASTWLG